MDALADGVKYKDVTKLKKKDLLKGTGKIAKTGNTVTVHYTGWTTDGQKFDASKNHDGKPFVFKLGEGRVIKGWDQGIVGMHVGGKRQLMIPPDLGYGASGFPPAIPSNATLVFEVELLAVN